MMSKNTSHHNPGPNSNMPQLSEGQLELSIPTVEPGTHPSYLPRPGGSSRERKLELS